MDEILRSGLPLLGVSYDDTALERLRIYYDTLTEKNKVINLTAISGPEDTARLHFLDCAALLGCADFRGKAVIDVGTGAGFPGMVLKILEPSIDLTLLDSLQKRVDFLSDVCAALGFDDVKCVHGRAEEFAAAGSAGRENFDIAVSRAVARLNLLSELCLPAVKPGGLFISMKGPDAPAEMREAENAVRTLGGRFRESFGYAVPGTDVGRCAVIIEKAAPSPAKYPRRFAKMQKQPL